MGEQVAAGFRKWGCSSVGRAPALQAGGQEFESLHLHSDRELSRETCTLKISHRELMKEKDIKRTEKTNEANEKQETQGQEVQGKDRRL